MCSGWAGVDIDEFPNLKAWDERMLKRPGVERGRHVPSQHRIKEMLADKEAAERYAKESAKYVLVMCNCCLFLMKN